MDLELLRTFLEVCRTRHFGQAAEVLCVTQAAVSARIKQLENRLGIILFDRSKREISLTPEAHRLKRHAELLLAEWRKARQEVTAGGARQQLTVGGSLRLWDVILQRWLHTLRERKPEIALTVETHTPELLTRKLLDGVLDLAFMLEPAQLDVLQIEKVADIHLLLVSSLPNQSLSQALADGYVMVDWGLGHGLAHRRLFPDMDEPHTRVSNATMALRYLMALGGSAYLPSLMVHDYLQQGRLYKVEDAPVIEHPAYAVYPLRSPKLTLIRATTRLFEQQLSEIPH